MNLHPKRSYFYLRQGWSLIAPIFGFGNFIMLIYITLKLEIPIYVFAPVIAIIISIALIFVGKTFLIKQQSTDLNLTYFEAKEALTTDLILWEQIMEMCKNNGTPLTKRFQERKRQLEERTT